MQWAFFIWTGILESSALWDEMCTDIAHRMHSLSSQCQTIPWRQHAEVHP
ncbi:hypothetical protein SOHN41_03083 [Shewanella sp. HN-41]|nr:hypothetical protein SOHN41_03083 [Shewanella sp. HN-41]